MNENCFEWLVELLDRRDPMGLLGDGNPGREYKAEAEEIVAALPGVTSAEDLQDKIHRIFVQYFDDYVTGPKATYADLAREIFEHWRNS
jgi:hypothetical protein